MISGFDMNPIGSDTQGNKKRRKTSLSMSILDKERVYRVLRGICIHSTDLSFIEKYLEEKSFMLLTERCKMLEFFCRRPNLNGHLNVLMLLTNHVKKWDNAVEAYQAIIRVIVDTKVSPGIARRMLTGGTPPLK